MGFRSLQETIQGKNRAVEQTALVCEERRLSYDQLGTEVARLAAGLQKCGIQMGDRVAWFLPNGIEAVLTTLACYHLGAVSVPLNHRYLAEEASYVLQNVNAKLVIYHVCHADVICQIMEQDLRVRWVVVGQGGPGQGFESLCEAPPIDAVDVQADQPALILYTSGSTGDPKGVVLSHAAAFAGIDLSRRIFEIDQHDRVLVGKPISHAGGLETQLMPTLLAGGQAFLAMNPSPEKAVAAIQEHQITQYAMLASDLLDFIEYLEQHPVQLRSLQNSIGSGDAVPTDLHQRFRDLFGWEVMEACGMTEIGGYYAANPRRGRRKWGSLGLPVPETTLKIVDEQNNPCQLREVGEIVIQTPSATTGYWNNPAATKQLFQDGWLHTGDLGYLDEDGYVWFVARKKLMIVRRGSNIAPAEVEAIIDRHPAVHACVVVGVADERDGHVPVAWISPIAGKEGLAIRELPDFVASHLAAYKNPIRYLYLQEFPRNSSGKFDRHKLAELAAENGTHSL